MKHLLILLISTLLVSCEGQHSVKNIKDSSTNKGPFLENILPLPNNGFYCGFLDSQGNLWFGSRGNGAFKYNGQSFTNYTTTDGLCSNDISCISQDKTGNIWFGTPSGACIFDGDVFERLSIPFSDTSSSWLDKVYPVVNPNQVMSILEDQQGYFWLGTNGAGAYKYDGNSFSQHLFDIGMVYEDDMYHNIILSIIEDTDGDIWFSSLSHGGVSVYDGELFTHYTNELSDDFIRVVYSDSKGQIWIGTHGNHNGGLDKFDGEQFTAYHKTNDGLSHNNVMGIYEDREGLLWLASGTTELCTFDGNKFVVFKDRNGKSYDKITFVLGGKNEDVWFGNRGRALEI